MWQLIFVFEVIQLNILWPSHVDIVKASPQEKAVKIKQIVGRESSFKANKLPNKSLFIFVFS